MSRRGASFAGWLALGALVCAPSCSGDPESPTQIVAIVDSDLEVPGALDRVTIEVDGLAGDPEDATADLTERDLPRSLTLVHSGGPLGPITVRARGELDGAVVVERLAIVRFERGKSLELRLPLAAACAGAELDCADDETCERGACESAEQDDLPAFAGKVRSFDAGPGPEPDAGPGENRPPECTIGMPSDGATFVEGDTVTLSGTCDDPESGPVRIGLSWESDRGGMIDNGARAMVSTLASGEHSISLCARDPEQLTVRGCSSVTITITAAPPVAASITSLAQDSDAMPPFATGAAIRAMATGAGVEPLRFSWTDSILGAIGEGSAITLDDPPKGKHTWTLTVTDARSNSASDSRNFDVLASGARLMARFGDAATRFDRLAAASNDRVFASGPARRAVYSFDGNDAAGTPSTVLDEGVLPDVVRDIALDEELGYAYFATQGFLVCPFSPTTTPAPDQCQEYRGGQLMSDDCNAIARVTGSNSVHYLLVGTARGLLVTSPSGTGGNATGMRRLNNVDVRAILAAGSLAWIATTQGLYSFDPASNALQRYAADGGAPSDTLHALALDSDGAIWVGSANGLGRFVPSSRTWTVWRAGSMPSPGLAADDVRDVAIAGTRIGGNMRDIVWVATSNGVSRFDPSIPSFTTFTDSDGLRSNGVRAISVLSSGDKLIATDQGVTSYDGL